MQYGSKKIGMGHLRRADSIEIEFIGRVYKPLIVEKDEVNGENRVILSC